jgi:hypothetical protein
MAFGFWAMLVAADSWLSPRFAGDDAANQQLRGLSIFSDMFGGRFFKSH